MSGDEREATDFNRRDVLVGGAASAAVATIPAEATAQMCTSGTFTPYGAVYCDPNWNKTFRNAYSRANIAKAHRIVRGLYSNRGDLQWGYYQKKVVPNANDWGPTAAFSNWEAYRDEMRFDLEKQPATFDDLANCINPLDPSQVAPNLVQHLDEVVRIALWDYAIPIRINVGQRRRRHHGLTTEWNIDAFPSVGPSLTINIDCPMGGWQGYAIWRNPSPGKDMISKFVAQWKVPPVPVDNKGPQVIFLFNGLESVTNGDAIGGILQPVLQWTKDGWLARIFYMRADFDPVAFPDPPAANATAENYSTAGMQNGAAVDNRTYYPGMPVGVNDTITGTIELVPGAGTGLQAYKCTLSAGVKSQTITTPGIPELVYAVCALESYYVDQTPSKSAAYPAGPLTLSAIDLETQHSTVPVPLSQKSGWQINQGGLGADYTTALDDNNKSVTFTPR